MNKAYIPVLLIASILFVSGCTSQSAQSTSKYSPNTLPAGVPATGEKQLTPPGNSIGNKAPDFTVTTTTGRTIKLREFTAQKKPVVLYFMATWCPFCKQEYGEIAKAYSPYSNVELLSVSLDLTENSQLLEQYRVSNNRPGDFAPGNRDILVNYDAVSTTTKYAISKSGVILYKGSGVLNSDNWKIIFDTLSKE